MTGLIALLQEVLITSKRNIEVVEKLLYILEKDTNDLKYDYIHGFSIPDYREDNLEDIQPFIEDIIYSEDTNLQESQEILETQEIQNILDDKNEMDTMLRKIKNTQQHQTSKETSDEYNSPTITPLSKLSSREQEKLLYKLFIDAKHNIKNIVGISEKDEKFSSEVEKEADRLLEVWLEINKK